MVDAEERAVNTSNTSATVPSFEAYAGTGPENYERYFVPAIGQPLANALVDVASVRPGQRVLDVACGTGIAARVAAERVGRDGVVAGADLNPGMLAVARSTPAGGTPITWHEAAADALPFPDGTFDLVLCQLGLQFFPDRLGALRDMRRVLAPSGRALVLVPGPAPEIFVILEEALASHFTPEVAAFVRVVFSLYDPDELRGLMAGAGFRRPDARAHTRTLRLPSPEEFLWQYVYSTPLAAAAADLDDQARAAVTRDVVASWRPFTQQGKLVLELGFSVASGET
jgi:ubiquinone/menaquinone biosynthesis C-methylase UbiE